MWWPEIRLLRVVSYCLCRQHDPCEFTITNNGKKLPACETGRVKGQSSLFYLLYIILYRAVIASRDPNTSGSAADVLAENRATSGVHLALRFAYSCECHSSISLRKHTPVELWSEDRPIRNMPGLMPWLDGVKLALLVRVVMNTRTCLDTSLLRASS